MSVLHLNEGSFETFTGQSGISIVDFWAPWCGPCKRLGPIFEKLAGEMTDVHFGKVNTDENQGLATSLGIMSIPTLMVFKDGQRVDQVAGALPEEQLRQFIQQHQ